MSENHTPGRIEVERSGATGSIFLVSEVGTKTIARVTEPEDARRLAACWNSCGDVPTDMLEQVSELGKATMPYRTMRAHQVALLVDLKEAAATLRRYETLHRAKGTPESDAKAEVNAGLAARFEATIAKAEA